MTIFNATLSNVLLTLLYLLPGFLLCKCRKVRTEHLSSISVILLYVCGPGMFLNALTALDYSPQKTIRMGLFLVFSLVGEIALMLLILLLLGKRRKEFGYRMLSIASVMGNVGFFGLPIEKVHSRNKTVEYLYARNNYIPTFPNNQIYSQGYFNELQNFVDAVEGHKDSVDSSLQSLRDVYALLENIKTAD